MPASKYKVWAWGAPVGVGATDSVHIGMAAIAKKSTPATPLIVGNELVCSMIARMALLPCPPGALLENNGDTYFCSLDFNTAGQALPPAPAAGVVAELPELLWGVILFDVLVMNPDRHAGNISYNRQTKELTIFDHSHAFLQANGDVDAILNANKDVPAIGGHCLAAEINTWNGFTTWTVRIKAMPDYYLEGAIEAGCKVGWPQAKKGVIYDFAKARRDSIDAIVTNNRGLFPKVPAAGP